MSKSKTNNYPPCPYCEKPAKMFAALPESAQKKGVIQHGGIRTSGRLWSRDVGDYLSLEAYKDATRFVAEISPDNFTEGYKNFRLRIIGVDIGFFVYHPDPPMPFTGHVLSMRKRSPTVLPPIPSTNGRGAYTLFSGSVLEHVAGRTRMEAHWWPSHSWIINQRVSLTASKAEERNAELEISQMALNLFVMETRGAEQKITDVGLRAAIASLGEKVTQKAVAEELGVSESALEQWRRRNGISTWREVVGFYAKPIFRPDISTLR